MEDRRQLQREVTLMKAVGQHPHIVCMLACSSPSDPAPAPYLVVEHCALGDLQNYLRQQWKRLSAHPAHVKHAHSLNDTSICEADKNTMENTADDATNLFINRAYGLQQGNSEEHVGNLQYV